MRSKARNALQNGLLSFFSLGLFFVGAEVVLRLFSPFPSYENEMIAAYPDRYDPRFGWAGIPDLERFLTLREFKVLIKTNSLGFRDGSFDEKLDLSSQRGSVKTMFLGDSFAWGWGVEAKNRVGEKLEAHSKARVTSFNLAQSGYGTDQQYLVYEDLRKVIQPSIVVVLFCSNDFGDCSSSKRYNNQEKPQFVLQGDTLELTHVPVPYDTTFWETKTLLANRYGMGGFERYRDFEAHGPDRSPRALLKMILVRSHFVNWLRFRLEQLKQSRRFVPDAVDRKAAGQDDSELQENSRLVMHLLERLRTQAHANQSKLLIVLVPDKAQVVGWTQDRAWQELVLSQCKARNIDCLDLEPRFRGHPGTYWRIDPHWTAQGHDLAAREILEYFETKGWLMNPR